MSSWLRIASRVGTDSSFWSLIRTGLRESPLRPSQVCVWRLLDQLGERRRDGEVVHAVVLDVVLSAGGLDPEVDQEGTRLRALGRLGQEALVLGLSDPELKSAPHLAQHGQVFRVVREVAHLVRVLLDVEELLDRPSLGQDLLLLGSELPFPAQA